jgi:hypothetical protein
MLGRAEFFLFRHGKLNRFWDRFQMFCPGNSASRPKKSSFFEKKSLSRVDDPFRLDTLLTPPEAGLP